MSLVRWNPLVASPLSRWPSVWDEDDLTGLTVGNNNLDLYETEDEVVVRANVAGVPAHKVDVTFEKGVLWIKAEADESQQDPSKRHFAKSSWSYSYKVAVPGLIDHSQEPVAQVQHGVITITFKKAEASKPKKVTVKELPEK